MLFSELKLVTDNLLSIYAAANREATETTSEFESANEICYSTVLLKQWESIVETSF